RHLRRALLSSRRLAEHYPVRLPCIRYAPAAVRIQRTRSDPSHSAGARLRDCCPVCPQDGTFSRAWRQLMSAPGLSDAPLKDPQDDLLGVSRFPCKLAELIRENPGALTVGIYGTWGSGKTSFVNIVEHQLKKAGSDFDFVR